MKHILLLLAILCLLTQGRVQAYDPTEVNGVVTIKVDRTKPVWTITVTNHSAQKLSYEMMGKVPRGLGLELWDMWDGSGGMQIHAEDLAESLNVDGFPANIREISPGKSQVFQLNPKSMSTTDDMALAKWERAKRIGYYNCRVFFGVYASRLMSVAPRESAKDQQGNGEPKPPPAWLADEGAGDANDGILGFRLRRMLDNENLSLVSWHRGSGREGDYHITYTTCRKSDLEVMVPLNENKPMDLPLSKLIAKAQTIARQKIRDCSFKGLIIDPCEDDSSKYYAKLYFADDRDDTAVSLLMNGASTNTTRLPVTEEQYKELAEYRIPKLREQNDAEDTAPNR